MSKHITITEYGYIGCSKTPVGEFFNNSADEKCFEALKRFNIENEDEIFTLKMARAVDGSKIEALKAKSFVGVIETKDGSIIEILPKILDKEDDSGLEETRAIFLGMLSCLKNTSFVEGGAAHLLTKEMNILEIFISLFLQEIERLVQKGIMGEYVNIEENRNYLKGKLVFNQHIKTNLAHQERFYISFDEFLKERPENRIIKSTLRFLSLKARSCENQKRLREFIFTFDEIPCSENAEFDFQRIRRSRLLKHYDRTLAWCKVFLRNESYTNFKGESLAFSLLFPMEKIFEDFVGTLIKRGNPDHEVLLQHRGHHLIADHDGIELFSLRPDIAVKNEKGQHIILDTKWKLIDQNKLRKNYLIEQSDFYQMFAYGEKYCSSKLYLLYPLTKTFDKPLAPFSFHKGESMELRVCPIDLAKAVKEKKLLLSELIGGG